MTKPIPSLSSQGLISDPLQKLDRLLAYIFVSEGNQTYTLKGRVLSVAVIRQQHENNPAAFSSALQSAVNDYMHGHFEKIAVQTSYSDAVGAGGYDVFLTVIVVDNSREYTSSWKYNTSDSKFVRVAKAVNTGV